MRSSPTEQYHFLKKDWAQDMIWVVHLSTLDTFDFRGGWALEGLKLILARVKEETYALVFTHYSISNILNKYTRACMACYKSSSFMVFQTKKIKYEMHALIFVSIRRHAYVLLIRMHDHLNLLFNAKLSMIASISI